jgi:putative sigma-54 modulation protein
MTVEQTPVAIEVTVRHAQGEEEIKSYARQRLDRIIYSLPNLRSALVEVTFEHTRPADRRYTVQVTLAANGAQVRVEDRGRSANATIDRAHDLLERRIRDWKGKVYYGRRREQAAQKEAVATETARVLPDDRSEYITRVKGHETKPMTPEDAVEQMELLGHDFYFFLNNSTGQHNVVYRRKAGGYGLIEPAPAGSQ